jgi:hypothetical protein
MVFAMMQTIVWVLWTPVAFAMALVTFMNVAVQTFQQAIATVKERRLLKATIVPATAWRMLTAMAYVIRSR